MSDLLARVKEAAGAVAGQVRNRPQVGIVLGTGLGKLAGEIDVDQETAYSDIPHFADTTVETHAGRLISGTLSGKNVLAMSGRFHYYEGYTMEEITFPVRVMKELGVSVLIISNAAGGMNPMHDIGDILIIEDHINMMGVNPLIGPNNEELGPRFPDMCEPYDRALIKKSETAALNQGIKAHRGVYVGVSGPNLETRAEYRFLRTIGADVVGMSTIPEVLVGVHAGLRVLGFSVITDRCLPDALKPAKIEEIIAVANESEPRLSGIVKEVISGIDG